MTKQAHSGLDQSSIIARLLELHILFPLFAVFSLLAIWGIIGYLIAIEGAAAERTAADTARELVEIYEAQMVRNLGAIDQALKTVKYAYEIDQKPTVLSSLDEKGLLPPKLIFTVSIANRAGEVIASTSSGKKEAIAERQYFLDHLVSDSDIPSIVPVRSTAGDWRIQFSRRLNAADGKFIGVVMVLVEPAYFTSGYERSRLGDFGVLGLVGPDGTFLARRSGDWVTVGESAKDIPASADDDNPKDTVLMAPSWASVEQYLNVRRIYRFPLTVIVGLSKSEQLDSFHRQKISYLRLAILASVLVIVVALVLTRLSWQLAESRKRTRKNQETYYAASEASLDAVFVLRREAMRDGNLADFVIDNVNHQGAVLFGKTKGDFLGKRLCELMPACRENGLLEELENVFQTGKLCEAEWENGHEDVDATWLYRQIVRVEDGVVVIVRDISSRKQEQERISHMAYHDALTGLPNRTLLHDRIQQAMLLARRYEKSMAVVFVDLDDFKAINDNYGHRIGDEVLKIQAKRMVQCLRQTDSVIRLGGDEFVIVMVSQPQNVDVLSPALDRLRDALAEPMHVEGIEMKVTPSIGVARYPNDGEDSETLLRNADTAMYQTKTHGRNNYQYYQHETDA